jgi:rRNA maturation protein Nop10
MLSDATVEEARGLRLEGLTCRGVEIAMAGRISKSAVQRLWPGYARRTEHCPTCGAMVEMPCRLCAPTDNPQDRFHRLRRSTSHQSAQG